MSISKDIPQIEKEKYHDAYSLVHVCLLREFWGMAPPTFVHAVVSYF
jgi:hypothetical protein